MPAFPSPAAGGNARVVQGFFKGGRPPLTAGAPVAQPFGNGSAFKVPSTVHLAPHGGGQPLPAAVLQRMEEFFGTSFADVRVHVGPQAASIGALAFTMGSDLYFAPGQYDPHSAHGQRLLGHELAHVVQQRAGRVRNPLGGGVAVVQDPALEAEAERMGTRVGTMPISPEAAVQRRMRGCVGVAQSDVAQPALGWGLAGAVVGGGVMGLATGGLGWLAVGATLLGGYTAHRFTEPPAPTFPNHQPQNLATEVGRYLAEWKRTKGQAAFVVCWNSNPIRFHQEIKTGQKFLWTYDTDGYLSIGSTRQNQHPVVAAGKTVYAAGTGQLVMSPEWESYLAFKEEVGVRARRYFNLGSEDGFLAAAQVIKNAENLFRTTPPLTPIDSGKTVELDFESGHYAPRLAWSKTNEAWKKAGYRIVKSTRGGHI